MGNWGRLVLVLPALVVFSFASSTPCQSRSERIITANLTEDDLEGYVSWRDFMASCDGQRMLSAYGVIDSIALNLVLNLDKGTIGGSLAGHASGVSSRMVEDHSFQGGVHGSVARYEYFGWWGWELEATLDMTLEFDMEQSCTGEADTTLRRRETMEVVANLTGRTTAIEEEGGRYKLLTQVDVYWENGVGLEGRDRVLSISCRSVTECDLELPKPFDLEVSISASDVVGSDESEAFFQLNLAGLDKGLADTAHWYVFYLDQGYGFYHIETYDTRDMSGLSLGVDDRRSWDEMARKHGTRSDGAFHLPMKIELAIDNEEGLEILPSMPFFPDYTEFTFTYRVEADSGIQLEIYPTEPNTTMLNVGGNGRDPVRLEVLGELPPYLEVSFDPEVVEARLGVSTEPAKWRWP